MVNTLFIICLINTCCHSLLLRLGIFQLWLSFPWSLTIENAMLENIAFEQLSMFNYISTQKSSNLQSMLLLKSLKNFNTFYFTLKSDKYLHVKCSQSNWIKNLFFKPLLKSILGLEIYNFFYPLSLQYTWFQC